MSFSNFLENAMLNHVFGKGVYTPPTIYVGLSVADPLEDGSGLAEPSSGSYIRKVTAAGDWNVSVTGIITNANIIAFIQTTGSWGLLTHFALFDAVSGGNMLAHAALDVSELISANDTAKYAVGTLSTSLN